jgi:hypothetical protein
MTGQKNKQSKSHWNCIACGNAFDEPMTTSGKPACPRCFAWDILETIAPHGHVFVTVDRNTGLFKKIEDR